MNDLISRQAAIDVVKDVCVSIIDGCESRYIPEVGEVIDYTPKVSAILSFNKEVRARLRDLPTVQEQERKKGRWVELYDSNYKCSECGAWWHSDDMDINEEFQFCPSCGAHMEGADDAGRDE